MRTCARSRGLTAGLAAGVVLCALAGSSTTQATAQDAARIVEHPTVWDRAANPDWSAYEAACRTAEKTLALAEAIHLQTAAGRERLDVALKGLQAVDALHAPDVRLRFYLGRLELLARNDERAMEALESAIAIAPDHPMATDAYFSLAIAYARGGRRTDEVAAYAEYLRRETDPSNRLRALSNLAESEMALELHAEALRDYQAAIELSPDDPIIHWGYAVALDRVGDPGASAAEARIAVTYDPVDQHLSKPSVFFVPEYDRYWYEGLGAMTRAGLNDDPGSAMLWWEMAVAKWLQYAAAAGPHDKWFALAKAHRITCERALAQAKRKAMTASGLRAR